jgi:N5-(cytidine 5'-diphosphoramidyl)-L-glutamine hydrolase
MSSMTQKIGISLRVVNATNYLEKRDALSHDWPKFLEKLDLIPILIPNAFSDIEYFLNKLNLDGFILSGGDNIGENEERDRTEEFIIKYGIQRKIPILGVCRGMQLINKFCGGSFIETSNKKHLKTDHQIDLLNPLQKNLFDENSVSVNSYHNNIITNDSIGNNLESFAICNFDGTIEGFIHKKNKIIGVMWHPERMQDNFNQKLINKIFVENLTWD